MSSGGDLVINTQFGPAIVLQANAKEVYVSLNQGHFKGLQIDVLTNELSELDYNKVMKFISRESTGKYQPIKIEYTKDISKKKSIEALRFGLVPEDYIEEMTLGYDNIEKWIMSGLIHISKNKPNLFEICGPFGTGKSHTMSVIRYIARREGYVTAKVEVDGQYISLSEPERLLNGLWNTISVKDFCSTTPLIDLYLKSMKLGYNAPSIAKDGIDRVKSNYESIQILKRKDLIDIYRDDIEALISSSDEVTASEVDIKIKQDSSLDIYEKGLVKLKRMIGRTVDERPYDFVESLAGHAIIAKMAGYKGLIITIDEFEVEKQMLSPDKLNRVEDLLISLTSYLKDQRTFVPAPLGIFVATTGQNGNIGDEILDEIVDSTDGEKYELSVWNKSDRLILAKKMYKSYCDTYGIETPFNVSLFEKSESELEKEDISNSGLIRAFIKRFISQLDRLYGPPAIIPT